MRFGSWSPSGADFAAAYRPISPPCTTQCGSLEAFLTERYCYYAVGARDAVYRCDIQHCPWWLSRAEACIGRNTLGRPFGLSPAAPPPLLHFARRTDAKIWPLRKVAG